MDQVGLAKRMMEEAVERGFWATDGVACTSHVSAELAGFITAKPRDSSACAACGATGSKVFDLDELLDIAVGVLRTYWGDAHAHLYFDSESPSGYALAEPATADDLVRDEIFPGDVDEALLKVLTEPDLLGDQQWFDPGRLWLEDSELIAYSWGEFHKWAIAKPETVDLVAVSTRPTDLFELSDEPADGIDPTHMLSRLTGLIEDHVGLRPVPAGTTWHRALVLGVDDERSPGRLGSAPAAMAAANRMSARGVSMFYGADHAATAVAEIRSAADDRVVTGTWHPARPLQMLDLVELREPPSFFDWKKADVRRGIKSLGAFAEAMSIPIAAGAERGYRSTQAFTEYLRRHLPGIDGIRYRSSLTGLPCCVVFADNPACDPASGKALTLELDGYTERVGP